VPDPTLFDDAYDNRGLFADHYLKERFPERDDVQALQPEADAAFNTDATLAGMEYGIDSIKA
jgi:hypothetical protein